MTSSHPPPAANPLLIGQARAEEVLLRAIHRGRLPHAWLFRGPAGIGKATLAYRFARRLLAGAAHEDAAANPDHAVFRMVAHGAHPDLRVLQRAANPRNGKLLKEISVEQVREADAALHATAAQARHKVLVVDAADELSSSAANALLKLVEEPPAGVVLVLVCQRRGLLPATIISRCAQLNLVPLAREQVLEGLGRLAPALTPDRAALLAELAGGSLGRAIELETTGWIERYAELLASLTLGRSGEAARLALTTRLDSLIGSLGFRGTADLMAFLLRRLAQLEAGRPPAVELAPDEVATLRSLSTGRGLDRWVALWEKLSALALRVESVNLDPLSAILQLVHGICGVEPTAELGIG